MKFIKKITIVCFLVILCVSNASGSDTNSMKKPGRHHGPPPEAYTACEGKSAGDSAEFVSPRGETVKGTCELEGDRLVLRPTNQEDRPDHPQRKNSDAKE